MGEMNVDRTSDDKELGVFMNHLLQDVHALELMLEKGMFESDLRRIGAEQELFLVRRDWHPALNGPEILERIDDPYFTTELARFNLEFNMQPVLFADDCLSALERQLRDRLKLVRRISAELGSEVVLTGILPTLKKSDLDLENMTPQPRYFALNEAMTRLRGKEYELHIQGIDEINIIHDSVMLEACNTSFQLHFQVSPDEFAELYNIAQLVSPPLLAGSTNSPLLFGKRLWRETRIAVFQEAVDTRRATSYVRESRARVSFGTQWVRETILEIFREDIARNRPILATQVDEDPFEAIDRNQPPELKALCLHNGTMYRWNRPCYGISSGKPHLRIENRVLPAGPSIVDSTANAAFFFGLLAGFSSQYGNPEKLMDFGDVRNNFQAAASVGLGAQFTWLNGRTVPAQELICDELLPLAREGLLSREVLVEDVDRYLGIFEERVKSRFTGSEWLLRSLGSMEGEGSRAERLAAVTAGMVERQKSGKPVHTWSLAELNEAGGWKPNYVRVEQFMRTDLVTVGENDTLDLVANIMDWERIRHIPVEDSQHRLVGLISYRALLRHFGRSASRPENPPAPVTRIMKRQPITVSPETNSLDAIKTMRKHKIGCLPVVDQGKLVGIITERDFMVIASDLLEKGLAE